MIIIFVFLIVLCRYIILPTHCFHHIYTSAQAKWCLLEHIPLALLTSCGLLTTSITFPPIYCIPSWLHVTIIYRSHKTFYLPWFSWDASLLSSFFWSTKSCLLLLFIINSPFWNTFRLSLPFHIFWFLPMTYLIFVSFSSTLIFTNAFFSFVVNVKFRSNTVISSNNAP